MKICHVIDYFHTDVGYQEYFLARDQARAGHDVTVVSSHLRQHTVATAGPDEQLGISELAAAGVQVIRLDARQLGHDRTWLSGLEGTLTSVNPEVAHVHGPFSPTTVRAVRVLAAGGTPVLVDNHIHEAIAPASTRLPHRWIYDAYRVAFGSALRASVSAWVGIGPHERGFLAGRLGLSLDKVEMIPLGFDPAVFGWDPALRQRSRSDLGVAPDEVVVALTGKLHAGKRPEALAAAVEHRFADSSVHLVVAGSIDSPSWSAMTSAAPRLVEAGRLTRLGYLGRHDLSAIYHAADAVVFPRLPSISIYEAAGTGALVLVGEDDFSRWLASLCNSIVPVGIKPLDLGTVKVDPETVRARRAADAAAVFAWSEIAAAFTARYERMLGGPT